MVGDEKAYQRADDRGDPAAPPNLGVLPEQRDNLSGAEAAYRPADQREREPVISDEAYRRAVQQRQADLARISTRCSRRRVTRTASRRPVAAPTSSRIRTAPSTSGCCSPSEAISPAPRLRSATPMSAATL